MPAVSKAIARWSGVHAPDGRRALPRVSRLRNVFDRAGTLTVVADDPGWLDYPVQPVVGRGRTGGTLFVANGSFGNGTPYVVALSMKG